MFALKRHLLAAILVAGFAAQAASAHAFLDHAQPRVGSHVKVSPHHVIIWFTEAVEPLFSRIQVFNSAGKEVDNKNTHRLHGKKAWALAACAAKLATRIAASKWRLIANISCLQKWDVRKS